jgi:hypothetical protein
MLPVLASWKYSKSWENWGRSSQSSSSRSERVKLGKKVLRNDFQTVQQELDGGEISGRS